MGEGTGLHSTAVPHAWDLALGTQAVPGLIERAGDSRTQSPGISTRPVPALGGWGHGEGPGNFRAQGREENRLPRNTLSPLRYHDLITSPSQLADPEFMATLLLSRTWPRHPDTSVRNPRSASGPHSLPSHSSHPNLQPPLSSPSACTQHPVHHHTSLLRATS